MVIKDSRIDAYIEKAEPYARSILKHIRKLIHVACPEVEETLKWQFPHFNYKGMMCSMAAFQKHCAFNFWKGAIMRDPHHILDKAPQHSMGQLGKLMTLNDLPSDKIFIEYIQEAMKLNDEGIKVLKKKIERNNELLIPDDLMNALQENKNALETFEHFSYSKKKEYVDWIISAKHQSTKEKRLATAIEWISEGKSRNWKYESP